MAELNNQTFFIQNGANFDIKYMQKRKEATGFEHVMIKMISVYMKESSAQSTELQLKSKLLVKEVKTYHKV